VRGQRIITAPISPSPDSPEPKFLILAVGDTAKAVPRQFARPVDAVDNFFEFFLEIEEPAGVDGVPVIA
jgi:hypothetical protein